MKNRHKRVTIIEHIIESDRNIYLDIENGALRSVGFSQGLGDVDLEYLEYTRCQDLTKFIASEIDKSDITLWSHEFFFPSPHWEEQIQFIDDCIWKYHMLDDLNSLSKNELVELYINHIRNQQKK